MVGFVREDEDEDGDIEMSFLRQSHKVANKLIMPNTADIGMVKRVHLKVILPDRLAQERRTVPRAAFSSTWYLET